jgi:hypothetical protein
LNGLETKSTWLDPLNPRVFCAEADLRAEARASGARKSKAVETSLAVWSEATE